MRYILALLLFTACTKSDIVPPDTIGDYRADTTYRNCQTIIYISWNTYRNGEIFQSFDAIKVIGNPCVKTKKDEIFN